MVKTLVIVLVVMGSMVTVPLIGVYLLLNNSGCPPTLMLSVVEEDSYYVQQGLVKNITNSDLDTIPVLKIGFENLLNNPDSLYTHGLTSSESDLLYNFINSLPGDSWSNFVFRYNNNYISYGIAVC